jgi:ferredoxin-NADP reductase
MRAELVNSVEMAPEIRQFEFVLPELAELKFLPGQFVSLSETLGEKKVTRAYSIATLPDGRNRFAICLNRVTDGLFSPHLFNLLPGESVEMKGPLGVFVWKQPRVDSVMVATGTGIVPYRPMLLEALHAGATEQFTLIYGTRHPQNLLYVEEFRALESQFPNFKFIPTVTRPDDSWAGAVGRVQPHVLAAIGDRRDIHLYACGLKEMVDSVREIGKELGFDRKQIVFEKYD